MRRARTLVYAFISVLATIIIFYLFRFWNYEKPQPLPQNKFDFDYKADEAGGYVDIKIDRKKSTKRGKFPAKKLEDPIINQPTDEEVELTLEKEQFLTVTELESSNHRKSDKPITQFVYHALHKTGSEVTREGLRNFCGLYRISCLTYAFCHDNLYGSWLRCAKKHSEILRIGLDTDFGSLSYSRLRPCCTKFNKNKTKFDALVEHFPLNSFKAKEFIARYLPAKAFAFTILRHPFDQFLSYFTMLSENNYQNLTLYNASATIDLFHAFLTGAKTLTAGEKRSFDLLSNSQAKELGWDGKRETLFSVLNFLKQLDFVGLFEEQAKSWVILARKLHWDTKIFNFALLRIWPRTRYPITKEMERKLTMIQYADLAVYRTGKSLFHHQEDESEQP